MHEAKLREQENMAHAAAVYPGYAVTGLTNAATGTKSASDFPEPLPLSACLPIRLASMQQGTTHKRRVLRGTIAVSSPVVMTSTILLIKDEAGDLITVRIGSLSRVRGPDTSFPLRFDLSPPLPLPFPFIPLPSALPLLTHSSPSMGPPRAQRLKPRRSRWQSASSPKGTALLSSSPSTK